MGKALATKLAQQGANVCIVARTKSKLDHALAHIKVLFQSLHPQYPL